MFVNSTSTGIVVVALAASLAIAAVKMFSTPDSGLQAAVPSTADEKSVQELEERFKAAIVEGDIATFERLCADEFTHTSHDGNFRTRAEWFKGRVQGRSSYVSYDVDELQIRIYGETAVVTGR